MRSLQAGCDLVLHCNGRLDEMVEVAGATGGLAGPAAERAARADAVRARTKNAGAGPPADAADRLQALLARLGTA